LTLTTSRAIIIPTAKQSRPNGRDKMKNSVGNGTIEYPIAKTDSLAPLKVIAMLVLISVTAWIFLYAWFGA